MFNSNTTNEYNYYDKQGRYIGTKRIVHLSNDAIHSMWLTKYDNGTEDSFHAADELFFYHLHNLANLSKTKIMICGPRQRSMNYAFKI